MLSFATEFPVKDTTALDFVSAIRKWLEGSPHTSLSEDQLRTIPEDGRWKIEAEHEQLEAMIARTGSGETAAFRHRLNDRKIEWTTTVVYSSDQNDSWIGIRTSRESNHTQLSLPPAKKPLLVRTIISSLGGGLDGELYVGDQPTYLKSNDVGMTTRLLNADADAYLPVIYISRDFDDSLIVNPEPLARNLGGMAHVIVEPNREFSKKIQRDVSSRNAFGGTVGVYWPNGDHSKYFLSEDIPGEFELRRLIVERIRIALCNRRPLARCTWSSAEAAVARKVLTDLRNTGSEDVDEYVSAFDAELKAKQEQLDESEEEIRRLKAKLLALDTGRDESSLIFKPNDQQEFFPGEFDCYLKDCLADGVRNFPEESRRKAVIDSALTMLPDNSPARDRRERLKEILRDYSSMTKPIRDGLTGLGFSISDDGKHYKLVYMEMEITPLPYQKLAVIIAEG